MNSRRAWGDIFAIAALALVYFIAGKYGLRLALVHQGATSVWPPSGIALAALLLWGYRLWPGVFIGTFLVNVTTAGGVLASLGVATGNTLEAIAGAWLVNRFANGSRAFDRARDVFKFALLAAAVSTVVSATLGVATLCLGGIAEWSRYWAIWLTWWLGDAAGDLMFAPGLILWGARPFPQWSGRQRFEALLLLSTLLGVGGAAFAGPLKLGGQSLHPALVCVPILLWAAVRFGQRETAAVTLLLSALALYGILRGAGSFARPDRSDAFLVLGTYMSMISLTGLAVAAEIEERKRQQRSLALQAEALREQGQLLDLAPVLVRDMNHVITLWTHGAARLFGWARQDALGRVSHDLLQTQFPESLDQIQAKLLAAGNWEGELAHRTRDGRQILVTSRWLLHHDRRGNPTAVLEVNTDVTERKRAERRMATQHALTRVLADAATLPEAAPKIIQAICGLLDWQAGALWMRDAKSEVLRCLELWHVPTLDMGEFETATSVASFARGVGLPGNIWAKEESLWIPDLLAPPFTFFRSPWISAAGLQGAFGFPIRSGKQVYGVMEFFSSHVREPDEELRMMLEAIGIQIGQFIERKLVEEERDGLLAQEQAARAEAEAANRAKDNFLAVVSHEIRTPLTAILGWARLLRVGTLDDFARAAAIETIERNAKLQAKIIEDLLSVSRIVAGKVGLDLRPIELSKVVERSMDAARPVADAKGLQLEVNLDRAVVSGDSERLQQVVSNLVSNAVKFTPQGGTLEIRLERVNSQAEITVSDTGPGIPADFLPHLFEPFRQAEISTGRAFGGLGLGLGLAIARQLVEMHGGTAEGMNRPDRQGALFRVRLPLVGAEREVILPVVPGRASGPTAMLAGVRVLLVDDNADARELMDRLLRGQMAEVSAVGSAGEALKALPQWKPDVLVSDIAMPGENGYVLISKVRALHPERGGATPALAVTAFAEPEARERALQAGFQAHLAKPIDPDRFAALIRDLAASRASG